MGFKIRLLSTFSLVLLAVFITPTEALAQAILPVSRGGTGASSFTAGSLLFSDGSVITQDNLNLFWDNTNNRLGIGTNSPTNTLSVNGNANISGDLTVSGNINANVNATNLVPYTGATQNVNLGAHNLTTSSLISSGDSIINGLTVGLGSGQMHGNTVLGENAFTNNINGDRNVAIGPAALFASTTSDNVAVGSGTLGSGSNPSDSPYTGDRSTAIGSRALQAATTGSLNTGVGHKALEFDTTGDTNTAMGMTALQFDTTGSRNVGIGVAALSNVITGGSNIGIGVITATNGASDNNSIVIGDSVIGAGSNTTVIGNSSIVDTYFGSSTANSNIHAKKLYLGSSSIPGCIIMGDTAGGISYITLGSGSLTVSSSPPSACQ